MKPVDHIDDHHDGSTAGAGDVAAASIALDAKDIARIGMDLASAIAPRSERLALLNIRKWR
jgi:hypothetical protein